MGDALVDVAWFVGLATMIGLPAMVVAFLRREIRTLRKFVIAGVAVGVLVAILAATSDLLVSRCREAGNTGCLDYGATGIQTLILVVYGLVSVVAALRIQRG